MKGLGDKNFAFFTLFKIFLGFLGMGEKLEELISRYEGFFSRLDGQEWDQSLPR